MQTTVTVRQNGVVTIPESIRKIKDIHEGDIIEIDILTVHKNKQKGGK